MDTTVTAIVLLAALMHAVWNALLKSSADRLVELAALNLAAGLVGLAAVPFVGFPAKESFPFLLASLLLHVGYYAFLVLSYARGGLSLVYPIARGCSPVLVALVSALFLGEVLNGVETLGVVIITASIAGLALAGGVAGLSSNAVLFSLGTSVTIAVSVRPSHVRTTRKILDERVVYGVAGPGCQRSGRSSRMRFCGHPSASLRSTSVRYGRGGTSY